jgi:hypothetical protein
MSESLVFIIWLLCVGISAILLAYFIKQNSFKSTKKEGFAVYVCPSRTTSFITDTGETLCCNGDVVNGECNGNLVCTLSPKSKSGLPTCSDLAVSEAAALGASKCPKSIPNYFGSSAIELEGCSVSIATADGLQPSNPSQPQCRLYKTRAEDIAKFDSCYNVIRMQQAEAVLRLPGCASAAAAAEAAQNTSPGNPSCPPPPPPPSCPPPPLPDFVITGNWVGARLAVQKRFVLPNSNIVYAIQQGQHVKMVVTDRNNLPITARYYQGSINDLETRASDMVKINSLGDAATNYLLSSAP